MNVQAPVTNARHSSEKSELFSLLKEKELWLMLAVFIAYFFPPLFPGKTFFFRDLYQHFYPQKLRWLELVRSGQSLLWDPYLHGGQPFLADINNLVLYPSNLLYLFLPLEFAFNLDIAGHVFLSAAAAYLLGRSLGFMPFSSLVVAAVYAFCGYTLSLTNLMNRLLAMPYLPLLVLFWRQFLLRRTKWFFSAAVLTGTFQILAGSPETTVVSFLFLLGWSLIAPELSQSASRKFLSWAALIFFTAGLSAIQIFPTAEMVIQSSRSADAGLWFSAGWPLQPLRIPELIFPGFFGETGKLTALDYWGARIEDQAFPYILSVYFGIICLALAVRAGFAPHDSSLLLSLRLRRFLLVFLLASLVLSLGRFLPFYNFLHEYVPGFAVFRYAIKFLLAAVLPVALLAACSIQKDFSGKPSKRLVACFFILSAACASIYASLSFSDRVALWMQNSYFRIQGPPIRDPLSFSFLHAFVFVSLCALIYLWRRRIPKHAHGIWIAVLISADLMIAGLGVLHYAPVEFLTDKPQVVPVVHERLDDFRLYRSPNPQKITYQFPENHTVHLDRWNLETLASYTAALYSIPVIFHEDYDRLAAEPIAKLGKVVYEAGWSTRLPILSAASVGLIVTADSLELPGVERIHTLKNRSDRNFYLYKNHNALPRVAFVGEVQYVDSLQEAARFVSSESFRPAEIVAVEGAAPPLKRCEAERDVTIEKKSDNAYRIVNDCEGYVVFSEPFYPGWEVDIDEEAAETFRANAGFTAVRVPAGEHVVHRYYLPVSFYVGLMVTLLTALWMVLQRGRLLRRILQ